MAITLCFIAAGVWALAMCGLWISQTLDRIAKALEVLSKNKAEAHASIICPHHKDKK